MKAIDELKTLLEDRESDYYDYVKCNNCEAKGLVEREEDTCPACGFTGGLMDIKQDISWSDAEEQGLSKIEKGA